MAKWQFQEAKKNLSQLIDQALADGPQIITRHGVDIVLVMPVARYRKLATPARNLADFLIHSPLRDSGLVVERDATLTDASMRCRTRITDDTDAADDTERLE